MWLISIHFNDRMNIESMTHDTNLCTFIALLTLQSLVPPYLLGTLSSVGSTTMKQEAQHHIFTQRDPFLCKFKSFTQFLKSQHSNTILNIARGLTIG
jgi:hypothetical protein